jgi:hypothetical protein
MASHSLAAHLHTCHDSALYPGAHDDKIHAWCVCTQHRKRTNHCTTRSDIPLFPCTGNFHHSNTLTQTPAPTCSQTYSTHTPCTLHPIYKHHPATHSSFDHTAAVINESSTGKLCTNLPSLRVNGLVQANNRASPPCHFVLSTPSIYKFFQEMARVFHLLLQARGNFTLIHFYAPKSHTERVARNAIRLVPPDQSRVCGF